MRQNCFSNEPECVNLLTINFPSIFSRRLLVTSFFLCAINFPSVLFLGASINSNKEFAWSNAVNYKSDIFFVSFLIDVGGYFVLWVQGLFCLVVGTIFLHVSSFVCSLASLLNFSASPVYDYFSKNAHHRLHSLTHYNHFSAESDKIMTSLGKRRFCGY